MTSLIPLLVLHAGVVVDADALGSAKAELRSQIALARLTDADAFERVAKLRAQLPELDARKRGPLASLRPGLERLGARGLWPMVEQLAFTAPPRGALKDSAWLALQASLLEACGALRDRRAAPVFEAVLRSEGQPFLVYRAAAEALGRLGDDAAAEALVAFSQGAGVRQDGVLAGMGACRRGVVARGLAAALDAHPEPARARHAIQGLSDLGNAWAWKTPSAGKQSEEVEVRDVAARALLTAYLAYDSDVRQAASNALMVVDAPHFGELLAAERRKGPMRPELEQLAQRHEASRVH